jgi:hypothetical protein
MCKLTLLTIKEKNTGTVKDASWGHFEMGMSHGDMVEWLLMD